MTSSPVLDFLMIGRWWHLELGSDVTVARGAKRLAESLAGRHDALAQVRMELREEVLRAARAAKSQGASDFYFAQEIVPEVVVPATLAIYWPDVPRDPLVGTPRLEAQGLARTLRETSDDDVRPLDLIDGWGVVRAEGPRSGPEAGAVGVTSVRGVRYWLLPPDHGRVVMLDFASPVSVLAHALREVYEAIVSTVSLRDSDPAPQSLRSRT